jgi:hypothetical protein
MTPHTTVPPAATLVPQPNDKFASIATAAAAAAHPQLISFLMNHAIQNELEIKRKQLHLQEQQKSYVSALVGKSSIVELC